MCKTCGCHSASLAKKVLQIGGMTCEHCQKAVESAVLALDGVLSAEVSLAQNNLTVQFDQEKTQLSAIKEAVEETGFDILS